MHCPSIVLAVLVGLSACPANAHPAYAPSTPGADVIHVPLSRNAARSFLAADGTVDSALLSRQIDQLAAKYLQSFNTFLANTGLRHFLDGRNQSTIARRRTGTVPLADQEDGLLWTGAFSSHPHSGHRSISLGSDTWNTTSIAVQAPLPLAHRHRKSM